MTISVKCACSLIRRKNTLTAGWTILLRKRGLYETAWQSGSTSYTLMLAKSRREGGNQLITLWKQKIIMSRSLPWNKPEGTIWNRRWLLFLYPSTETFWTKGQKTITTQIPTDKKRMRTVRQNNANGNLSWRLQKYEDVPDMHTSMELRNTALTLRKSLKWHLITSNVVFSTSCYREMWAYNYEF